MASEVHDWGELLKLAALNQLALASFALRMMDNPKIATEEMRHELIVMIEQLEDSLAQFEEFII